VAEDEVERIVRQELETKLIKMLSAAIKQNSKEHSRAHSKEHSKDQSEAAASTLSRQFLYVFENSQKHSIVNLYSKFTRTFYSKYTTALTFENFCQPCTGRNAC
jgi:hypothetical protein